MRDFMTGFTANCEKLVLQSTFLKNRTGVWKKNYKAVSLN